MSRINSDPSGAFASTRRHVFAVAARPGLVTLCLGLSCRAGLLPGRPSRALAAGTILTTPAALAIAADGTVYVADTGNHRVVALLPDGSLRVIAGTAQAGASGDGGPASEASLRVPMGLAVAPDGTLAIADTGNHRVRVVGPDGVITTVAGSGAPGDGGDCGAARTAQLYGPRGLALAGDGSLFIADTGNHRVRQVTADGAIASVAGASRASWDAPTHGDGGDGGPATAALLEAPNAVLPGPDGRLYVADTGNHRVRLIGPDGLIHTVAGTGTLSFAGGGDDGPATMAQLVLPSGLARGRDGSLYVADVPRMRRIDSLGTISTVAGGSAIGMGGDGGVATAAQLVEAAGVAVAADGSLYIVDAGASRVRKVDADGRISTIAGMA